MDNTSIRQIAYLLKNNNLKGINDLIATAEDVCKANMEVLEGEANGLGISIRIDESYNISRAISELIGVSYLTPSYQEEFKSYTARCSGWHILFYAIRDTIGDYHAYLNGEIYNKAGTEFKMSTVRGLTGDIILKEYQNGKTVYRLTDELEERISLIQWIDKTLNENMKR